MIFLDRQVGGAGDGRSAMPILPYVGFHRCRLGPSGGPSNRPKRNRTTPERRGRLRSSASHYLSARRQLQYWESSFVLFSHSCQVTPGRLCWEDIVGRGAGGGHFRTTGKKCFFERRGFHFENAVPHQSGRHARPHRPRILPRDGKGICKQAHSGISGAVQVTHSKFLRKRLNQTSGSITGALRQFDLARNDTTNV